MEIVFFNDNNIWSCDYYFESNNDLNFVLGVLHVKADLIILDLKPSELKPEQSKFDEDYDYKGFNNFERVAWDRFPIGKSSDM